AWCRASHVGRYWREEGRCDLGDRRVGLVAGHLCEVHHGPRQEDRELSEEPDQSTRRPLVRVRHASSPVFGLGARRVSVLRRGCTRTRHGEAVVDLGERASRIASLYRPSRPGWTPRTIRASLYWPCGRETVQPQHRILRGWEP